MRKIFPAWKIIVTVGRIVDCFNINCYVKSDKILFTRLFSLFKIYQPRFNSINSHTFAIASYWSGLDNVETCLV